MIMFPPISKILRLQLSKMVALSLPGMIVAAMMAEVVVMYGLSILMRAVLP